MYDVIIAGGGPAGLSAALVLGRCRRKVLLCDVGSPRNERSHGVHCFLSREGILPCDLLSAAREQLQPYGVEIRAQCVTASCLRDGAFEATLANGESVRSRRFLIATGVVDVLPSVPGLRELYGTSVFHCPYCDGWEVRDQPLALYAKQRNGAGAALALRTWSADLVLCTDGPSQIPRGDRERLERCGIRVEQRRILRLEGDGGQLRRIVFNEGDALERRALFFTTGQYQRSDLPRQLGCPINDKGTVRTNRREGCNIPGLYIAGDASHDVQFVVVAAAEGAKAAVAIHQSLQEEENA